MGSYRIGFPAECHPLKIPQGSERVPIFEVFGIPGAMSVARDGHYPGMMDVRLVPWTERDGFVTPTRMICGKQGTGL